MTDSNKHQGIERFYALLNAIAKKGAQGSRLADIVHHTGLSLSTAHRLLTGLIHVGLVEQTQDNPNYFLGFDLYAMGCQASERYGLVNTAQDSLSRLAETFGDTIYLQTRSGNDSVCLERKEGAYPIKTLTLAKHDRRPLGIGAGGLALLAFLPPNETDKIICMNQEKLAKYPEIIRNTLSEQIQKTRIQGYALNPGLVIPGMKAAAVALYNQQEHLIGALSIAAIESRMHGARLDSIIEALFVEANLIKSQITT